MLRELLDPMFGSHLAALDGYQARGLAQDIEWFCDRARLFLLAHPTAKFTLKTTGGRAVAAFDTPPVTAEPPVVAAVEPASPAPLAQLAQQVTQLVTAVGQIQNDMASLRHRDHLRATQALRPYPQDAAVPPRHQVSPGRTAPGRGGFYRQAPPRPGWQYSGSEHAWRPPRTAPPPRTPRVDAPSYEPDASDQDMEDVADIRAPPGTMATPPTTPVRAPPSREPYRLRSQGAPVIGALASGNAMEWVPDEEVEYEAEYASY